MGGDDACDAHKYQLHVVAVLKTQRLMPWWQQVEPAPEPEPEPELELAAAAAATELVRALVLALELGPGLCPGPEAWSDLGTGCCCLQPF